MPINIIPAKNDITVTQKPPTSPNSAVRHSFALGNISTNDTYIITPAENPRAIVRSFVFVRLAKNARALPMPVDRPANNVRPNAIRMLWDCVIFYHRFLNSKTYELAIIEKTSEQYLIIAQYSCLSQLVYLRFDIGVAKHNRTFAYKKNRAIPIALIMIFI